MSLDSAHPEDRPVGSAGELANWFRAAERPAPEHEVGLEHEKLICTRPEGLPVPYEGERGIGALLEKLEAHGWSPFRDGDGPPIALLRGKATVSLEPGGQFELSGSPQPTARAAHEENLRHLDEVREACAALGLMPVALGYRPFSRIAEMPWMPKRRYRAMREVLPKRGGLAKDMMLLTATGQVSLDFSDEADCAKKITCASRLTPLLVALYANSPLVAGKPCGWLSFRSRVWTDVDPSRCGVPDALIDGGFSYARYVEWALDAPLLFLRRGDTYLTPEITFRQLLEKGFEGKPAFESDWVDHLSTLFPEVRLKKVIEVRGADCVGADLTGALAALWRGLFYDPHSLEEASRLLPSLSPTKYAELFELARKEGLRGTFEGRKLSELATRMVEIAVEGLKRLDPDDAPLLEPLLEVARSGRSPAEAVLEAYAEDPRPEALLPRFAL